MECLEDKNATTHEEFSTCSKTVREAVTEYEAQITPEAQCARTPTGSNTSFKLSNAVQPATPAYRAGSTLLESLLVLQQLDA